MAFTTAQTTIIAILAVFLTFIIILFLFCLISSRKARKDDEIAQKAVLGKWKENNSLALEIAHLPPIPISNNNSSYSLNRQNSSTTGPSAVETTREEKRGSGLAGIGTFSATASKQGIISPRIGNTALPFPNQNRGQIGTERPDRVGGGGIFRRSFTEIRDTFRDRDRMLEEGQPRRNPMPTLSRPLSWSNVRGITRSRSRSKSDLNKNNNINNSKSRFKNNQNNPPPLPRRNSARSLISGSSMNGRSKVISSSRNTVQR